MAFLREHRAPGDRRARVFVALLATVFTILSSVVPAATTNAGGHDDDGSQPPLASNLNFVQGLTIPNAVFAKLGPAGSVCLFTSARTHVVVDVNGWFA